MYFSTIHSKKILTLYTNHASLHLLFSIPTNNSCKTPAEMFFYSKAAGFYPQILSERNSSTNNGILLIRHATHTEDSLQQLYTKQS